MSTYPSGNRSSSFTLGTFLLLLLLVVLLIFRFWPEWESRKAGLADKTAALRAVEPRGNLDDEEKTNIQIFETCAPSTVQVQTFALARQGARFVKVPQGSGTGLVWDDKGRIVTNFHVVATAKRPDDTIDPTMIQVTLANGKSHGVVEVNFAVDKDLAVLWTDAPSEQLPVIKVGESKTLKVGQKVFAIGNPFGLEQSLTTGIISALGRKLHSEDASTPFGGLIQTDAAINPGNSGGPLLDSAGRLIGVNTAIVSPSGASAGIGFAIPVDEVNQVVTQLIRREKKVRPVLGIYLAPDQVLQQIGLQGVLVMGVVPNGPASQAGFQPTTADKGRITKMGDIIVALDGKKITSPKDLFQTLEKDYQAGQQVTVTVLRDAQGERKEIDLKVTLSASTR